MIDSNAVLESGLANGNIQFLGSFDECLGLKIPKTTKMTISSKVNKSNEFQNHDIQYCTVDIPISMVLSPNEVCLCPIPRTF